MKKFLILLALIAAASAVVALIDGEQDADSTIEEANENLVIDYLGV